MMTGTPTQDQLRIRSRTLRLSTYCCLAVVLVFTWLLPHSWWPIETTVLVGFFAAWVVYIIQFRKRIRATQTTFTPEAKAAAKQRAARKLRRTPWKIFLSAACLVVAGIASSRGQVLILGAAFLIFASGASLWAWVRKNSR